MPWFLWKKKAMSLRNEEIVQFVSFETPFEGLVEKHQLQQSWLPVVERYFLCGINTIVLSERVKLQSSLNRHNFFAKSCWASDSAIKGTFPAGLPLPSERGQIKVTQVGIFRLISSDKDYTQRHKYVFNIGFKALTMIPAQDTPTKEDIMPYADYISSLQGFEGYCIYKLHDCSGPVKEWHYSWILEAFFNSDFSNEESVLNDLVNCPERNKKWEVTIHKDYVQMRC